MNKTIFAVLIIAFMGSVSYIGYLLDKEERPYPEISCTQTNCEKCKE